MKTNTLDKALERLCARHQFGIKLGLEPVQRLFALAGNPQRHVAVVHVAGTNGKGSVSAAMEPVLKAAGLRSGLYTSPHLVRFQERIRLDGEDVPDAVLACALARGEQAAARLKTEQGHEATFFEMATVIAFLCFQAAGVQVAVVETGLGGRLDATNVVVPLISVITRIAMDHEAYLGATLEAVAGEKAGIIKPGRPVVAGPQAPGVEAVLRRAAMLAGAPYTAAAEAVRVQQLSGDLRGQKVHCETAGGWSGTVRTPLPGPHQLENLGIALTALEQVFALLGLEVPFSTVRSGLLAIRWRGRFEVLREKPLLIADAAHNPSGAAMLAETLKANGLEPVLLVTGMCGDKDAAGVVKALAGVVRRVWAVPVPNARSLEPAALAALFARAGVSAEAVPALEPALAAALSEAQRENMAVVVTGSVFLLGELLAG